MSAPATAEHIGASGEQQGPKSEAPDTHRIAAATGGIQRPGRRPSAPPRSQLPPKPSVSPRPCCSAAPFIQYCSTAYATELLGAVRSPGRAVCRGMVPAAPYRSAKPRGRWRPKTPFITEPFAQRFRGRGGGGNYCLHARRTDPVARKFRLPAISLDRPTRSERRRSFPIPRSPRPWSELAPGGCNLGPRWEPARPDLPQAWRCWQRQSPTIILPVFPSPPRRSPAPDIACCFSAAWRRSTARAPASTAGGVALGSSILLAYVSLGAVSLLLGAVGEPRTGSVSPSTSGAGVIALFSVITVRLGRDDARSVVSGHYSVEK